MNEYFDEAGNPIDLAKLAEFAEATSIWRPRSVEHEPETRLTQWRVYRVEGIGDEQTTHLVGYGGYEGRVCSPVQSYDPTTKRAITRSGRVYELLGDSGYNRDAMYVWSRWCDMNGVTNIEDVTEVYEND